MKFINNWRDLEEYGIDALTGEACGLSYRLLCDLTARGRRIVGRMLGVPSLETVGVLPENWNNGSKDDPHVASVMLAHPMLMPGGVFCLLDAGCQEVWIMDNDTLIGIEKSDTDDLVDRQYAFAVDNITRKIRNHGDAGDRCRHQMTGRVV